MTLVFLHLRFIPPVFSEDSTCWAGNFPYYSTTGSAPTKTLYVTTAKKFYRNFPSDAVSGKAQALRPYGFFSVILIYQFRCATPLLG
ncbi:MAG: hypothetical protein RH949_00865 [Coleofasciculus sp. A1-SPW-01]|uniref:hypothetical protein n=1 Tax=Coleofasciculus TaxID=669368 RepID=UPI0002DE9591|nr:hypothetical protein [Coleofasciculus chthonoplastes]